ncbi:hypothetical protein BDK51DRAFT_15842 [Blyttiomyces helicus]|uniref:Sm domain-containing protein n=1 Tax=Blyttiomyces helicus TaxID=388810 RepID=A0A4P9WFG4_9FUNG|nr:hypothetical protein BDK51DRAFT_15842 [Blyttiomyces helicus]|eukprot:RKO90493.1 hypothetical protein BDK51DRAFT_15842 [Blyttiomyces helicus]
MPETDRVRSLRQLLHLRSRLTTTDGRVFVGQLVCIDKGLNLILNSAEEYKNGTRSNLVRVRGSCSWAHRTYESRFVGLVMIPGVHLVKAEVEDDDDMFA